MRRMLFVALLCASPCVAAAQSVALNSDYTSGTISADGGSVVLRADRLGGFGSVKVHALDSYSGTWEVQCAANGETYDTGVPLKLMAADGASTVTSVTDSVGLWDVQNAGGCRAIRVIATAGFAASDTAIVISASQGGGGGGGGGAAGAVSNAGTFAVQEDGAALTALQLIDNLVSVEDAVAGSGFSGMGILAVRQDSHSDLAADGDFIPVTVDADGGLRVSIVAGAGSGGTALADDADFTAGTTSFTPGGGFYQSSVTACTDGDTCAFGITAQRALKVTLFESDGTELTPSSDQTEDAASAGAETGPMVLAIRDDTLDARSGTEGDFEPLHTNANGALWAIDVNSASALTALQLIDNIVGVEDAAETAGGGLAMAGTVRRDTAASSAGTTGDNATLNTDNLGRLWARDGRPCADHARITHLPIEESTAAINEIVPLNGSDLIYVCSYKWVTTAANSLQWVRGTGTDCGTGTADIEGPQPYAATGGVVEAGGGAPLFVVAAGNALCLQASAATAHGGRVSYVRTAAP